jgi:hypothetical protein
MGVAVAGGCTLAGSGALVPVALNEHGVVDQERNSLGHAVKAPTEDGVENSKSKRGHEKQEGSHLDI